MSRPPGLTPRSLAILAEIRETNDTFQAIAERHGLTRERVRQIALAGGIKGRRIKPPKRYRGISVQWFVHLVRRHLAEIGHGYCCMCHAAKSMEDMAVRDDQRCKRCVADRAADWRSKPGNMERLRAWQKANAEKMREYQRRHSQKRRASA